MGLDLSDLLRFVKEYELIPSIVTIIVGYAAYFVYTKQKDDAKKSMANIILLEIRNAEKVLAEIVDVMIGEMILALPGKKLLSTESWSQNKHLFVQDFDRDEFDKITVFYTNCKLFDEAIDHNESLFRKNEDEIRRNMLSVPAGFYKEYVHLPDEERNDIALEECFQKSKDFQTAYISKISQLMYSPNKPVLDAKEVYPKIQKELTLTSVGIKLKRLAGE